MSCAIQKGSAEVCKKHFISEIFDEDRICRIGPGHPYCLATPPDSGKTTLVLKKICGCARARSKKVLLLVNRRAVFGEIRVRMIEAELEEEISDNHLEIWEIQSLEGNGKTAEKLREKMKDFKYICIDECHYFTQDARFNPRTQVSFECIVELIPSHICFFLSGTPKDFIALMEKKLDVMNQERRQEYEVEMEKYEQYTAEKFCDLWDEILEQFHVKDDSAVWISKIEDEFEEWKWKEAIPPPEEPEQIKLEVWNEIVPDYSRLDIHHYRRLDDLIPLVLEGRQKWIVFVNSKKEGKRFKKILDGKFKEMQEVQKSKCRVVFLDSNYQSEKKATKVMQGIFEQGKLKAKVLITTSVLDNGINILDPKLSNLVLMTFDDTDAIQMIGRKRLRNEERLNLYLPYGTQKFFSKQLRNVVHEYQCLRDIANNGFVISANHLLNSTELLQLKDRFFYELQNGNWNLGQISFFMLYRQYRHAKEILNGLQENENFFLGHQYHMLGLELKPEDIVKKDVGKRSVREQVINELDKIKQQDFPIICKTDFEYLAKDILSNYGETVNTKSLMQFNRMLQELGMHERFERMPLGNKTFYYLSDMEFPGLREKCVEKAEIQEKIAPIRENFEQVYRILFEGDIPTVFQEEGELLGKFINETLKKCGVQLSIQRNKSKHFEVREKQTLSKTE
ncbi:DEAD/DEAH box helicase family protein [Lachnospiraceae bacterium 45-W7]